MFNLLVHGHVRWWETPPFSMELSRFKEYSGEHAKGILATDPASLAELADVPTLLMYEVGVSGASSAVVRLGRLANVALAGSELTFEFVPQSERCYLRRDDILRLRQELNIDRFEPSRTHWAIKDGDLPPELLELATAAPPLRTVEVVATELRRAMHLLDRSRSKVLLREMALLPTEGFEKAWAMFPWLAHEMTRPEHHVLLRTAAKTPAARSAVEKILTIHVRGDHQAEPSWTFALVAFLDRYGSPTEGLVLQRELNHCRTVLAGYAARQLTVGDDMVQTIAGLLILCASSRLVQTSLRQEVTIVLRRLLDLRGSDIAWSMWSQDGQYHDDMRATATVAVALQRLGGDKYHTEVAQIVGWILSQQRADGAFSHISDTGEAVPDVVATTFALEALRRSALAPEISHVLERGERYLQVTQSNIGQWEASGWDTPHVTRVVLQYLHDAPTMLSQVDGFLLMARGFFQRAEDLAWEDGPNNRRLAAIATVHAVEMFLYGVFQHRDDLNLSAFRSSGTETIGLRDAMRALQDALRISQPGASLKFRDQLSSLVGRRNGIIHGADEISATQLAEGMKAAKSFIDKYSYDLLKLDLLQ